MRKFLLGIPKVLFAVTCYISALLLAVLSGYFTVKFYSDSQTGYNMYAMAGLAGMLEFIKMILAVSYPFMQYRDIKRENKVKFYLKICFFLSIMASLNFFLTGGEIERSPASNITALIYNYIPLLEVIPLKFAQFIATMSLSILIEAFIIFLPILAPILFLEKDLSRKKKYNATTNFEKLKEIIVAVPERIIDRLYQRVVNVNSDEVIKVKEISRKPIEIGHSKDIDIVRNAIINYKDENISPSINALMDITGLSKNTIIEAKKDLEKEGIIRTIDRTTFVLDDTSMIGGGEYEN
jgi:hypothetical protein